MQLIGTVAKVTVANHAKYSQWIDLQGLVVVGLFVPDIDGTHITFEGFPRPSTDKTPAMADTGYPVCNTAGTVLDYTVADTTFVAIAPEAFLGVRWLRLKTTTDQNSDREIILQTTTWGA